jgi:TPR repeat protein
VRAEARLGAAGLAVLLVYGCRASDDPPRVIGDMARLEQLAQAGDAVRINDLLASDPGLAHASWAAAQNGPLHLAATNGHLLALGALLDRGMSPDGRILRGEAALHAAAGAGKLDAIRFLLDHGANVNVRAHDGRTPLHVAVLREEPDVTDLLLSRGADPDLRDQEGSTPLHTAVAQARLAQMAALCAAGAETGVKDEAKRTPLEKARAEAGQTTGLKWAKQNVAWLLPGGPCARLQALRRQGRPPAAGHRNALVFDTRCTDGDAWACGRVGRIYEEGQDGVPMDLARAYAYAEKGCAGNDGFSCGNVAYAHMTGKGAKKDDVLAAAMLRRGCDAGSAWSCGRLAQFYRRGRGVNVDPARAVALAQKACEGGFKDACASDFLPVASR